MKAATIFHPAIGLFIILFPVFCLVLPPQQAQAQDSGSVEASGKYSREELAQMLAPIALYPDALLSQVLMASTYPIEVVEADRWIRRNPGLKGETLDAALLNKDWSPSVKAICHFPSILALMSERITETTNLGNAFLAQEAEVMGMVQELRASAYAQGNLTTTSRQKVIVEKEVIVIEPVDASVIYVPYYDPYRIYGPWWYPAYPPYYWVPPGVSIRVGISYWPGFYFGFAFGTWSYFDWYHHSIYINVRKRPRYVRHDRWIVTPGRWQHDPRHRRGVAYLDKPTARKYGQYPRRSRDSWRDTRGFPEQPARPRIQRGDDRTKIDRDRQERERLERERQTRQRTDQERRAREQVERDRQIRQQADRERQERQRIDRARQERERAADRERQMREQAERNRQQRTRTERERQTRQRTDQERRTREQADQKKQVQKRVERSKAVPRERVREQSRDNVFNRVDDGRMERESSERGQFSRQGRGGDSRGRGRSDSDGRGGRDNKGRDRR